MGRADACWEGAEDAPASLASDHRDTPPEDE